MPLAAKHNRFSGNNAVGCEAQFGRLRLSQKMLLVKQCRRLRSNIIVWVLLVSQQHKESQFSISGLISTQKTRNTQPYPRSHATLSTITVR
jgi:hypothetical protein